MADLVEYYDKGFNLGYTSGFREGGIKMLKKAIEVIESSSISEESKALLKTKLERKE